MPEKKRCSKCKSQKRLDEFPSHKGRKDNKSSWCKKCKNEALVLYRKEYPDRCYAATLRWRISNPGKRREQDARRMGTPRGKLNNSMSNNIRRRLKGNKKGRHWETLVGYTITQLKKHLEKRFLIGMTWQNYGNAWEIDHKIPLSAFNFEKPENLDFKRCWSLKNLQPMWAKENISKGAKIDRPFQPSLAI